MSCLGFPTSWESSDYFLHSVSFSLPKQLGRKRWDPPVCLAACEQCSWYDDPVQGGRGRGRAELFWSCSKTFKMVNSHPLFFLKVSGGYHWFPTNRALRKGGQDMCVSGRVGCCVIFLFCSIYCLNPGNVSENHQGGTECAGVSFSLQEVIRRGRGARATASWLA